MIGRFFQISSLLAVPTPDSASRSTIVMTNAHFCMYNNGLREIWVHLGIIAPVTTRARNSMSCCLTPPDGSLGSRHRGFPFLGWRRPISPLSLSRPIRPTFSHIGVDWDVVPGFGNFSE